MDSGILQHLQKTQTQSRKDRPENTVDDTGQKKSGHRNDHQPVISRVLQTARKKFHETQSKQKIQYGEIRYKHTVTDLKGKSQYTVSDKRPYENDGPYYKSIENIPVSENLNQTGRGSGSQKNPSGFQHITVWVFNVRE
jgi:hypothetical protein